MEPLSANDPRMIGEFRLHAQLGAGGMGQVYLGFSPAGRAVAVKVIHPQFARDQEFLRRFSHEVAAASAVGGMYTAPVVDYDLNSATPWLATAYVPGPTLATFVSKHGPLPEAALWRLAAGLAEALRAVHAKGLIHRDLKPANVLLADNGPHVIDFGISRAASSMTQLTSAGMAIGTPGYMSPEQVQVEKVGPPSDMFSLGCVLAYAATGTPPFNADNPATILYRIVATEPDLSAVLPGLRQVIQACLGKNPAGRPAPGQLITMISQLGPATPASLGSFWPDAVARAIAAEQAAQTPTGLTPPAPFAVTSAPGAGGTPGTTEAALPAGLASPAPASSERTPTALATPPPGQTAGATGHAPMIVDGYYAAAQQPFAPAQAPAGPSASPISAPRQAQRGQAPPAPPGTAQPSFEPNPFTQTPSGPGAPYPGQAPPYGRQPPSYPGQQPYPRQWPGGVNALPPYVPGRRKPMIAEIPQTVRNAISVMYAGLAATVVDIVASLMVLGRYVHNAATDQGYGHTAAAAAQNSMASAMATGLLADFFGIVCWAWLAAATRRGRGWPRIAGTVLLGLYSAVMLLVVLGTKRDTSAQFTTFVVWVLGVAAVIPLWTRRAREFFFTWRRRR